MYELEYIVLYTRVILLWASNLELSVGENTTFKIFQPLIMARICIPQKILIKLKFILFKKCNRNLIFWKLFHSVVKAELIFLLKEGTQIFYGV